VIQRAGKSFIVSMKMDVVNKYGAEKIAFNLDRKGDGEAVIAEFRI
jgi:hypothetical protein